VEEQGEEKKVVWGMVMLQVENAVGKLPKRRRVVLAMEENAVERRRFPLKRRRVELKEGESQLQNPLVGEGGRLLAEKDHLAQMLVLKLEKLLKGLKSPTNLRLYYLQRQREREEVPKEEKV
jgi:hypothetical protein